VRSLITCAILQPGSYRLDTDLTCDVSVTVGPIWPNCENHSINHITLTNVSASTVANCNAAAIELFGVRDSVVIRNHTRGVGLQISAGIDAKGGSGNRIVDNVVDGAWNGDAASRTGADDGVLLYGESGDIVQGNVIRNVRDAGIEGVSSVTNTIVSYNAIERVAIGGIGAYRNTKWRGNTIEGNLVSQTQSMFLFMNEAVGGVTSGFAFWHNQILNNRFYSQTGTGAGPPARQTSIQATISCRIMTFAPAMGYQSSSRQTRSSMAAATYALLRRRSCAAAREGSPFRRCAFSSICLNS
jgi:parallel beta helix pectate lyase-like protein